MRYDRSMLYDETWLAKKFAGKVLSGCLCDADVTWLLANKNRAEDFIREIHAIQGRTEPKARS